jgi:sporulation protein YlmC with PRC-barrel domain
MLKIKRLSDVVGHKVYTDAGDLFGVIEEVNLVDNKVDGWRIVVSRESSMMGLLGGARGIIVPHQFIRAIGDIILISKTAVPVTQAASDEVAMDDGSEDLL